ncbi:ATP-binding cassette domain-containing protein [Paenibacillus sp. GCM10027627]|uniref:ABC transporter ATP-binding protein n=1 Tax=unclassified Paenibacillus TaxID=185978 RepID=UPI003627D9C7
MGFIEVNNICKNYKIPVKGEGTMGKIKKYFKPEYEIVNAVDHISLSVEEGEIIGYLGPNGAGKSTTLKMLSGIIHPTSGEIRVDGMSPYLNQKKYGHMIGVVFGQKSQLWWDLPAKDSLELYRDIYNVSEKQYKKNIDMFVSLLSLEEYWDRPIRNLSLGQRMRVEIAAALLHDPKILFLDEPTIGLDIIVKEKVRQFLIEINAEKRTTIFLTTHDISDIESVCGRIVIINKGKKIFDGPTELLEEMFSERKEIVLTFEGEAVPNLEGLDIKDKITKTAGNKVWIQINKDAPISDIIKNVVNQHSIIDIHVSGVELEKLLALAYTSPNRGESA